MRYYINFDKTINQLVPYYIGGRKLILYLQALMSPLRRLNDDFVSYAKETRIEAAMTSQIFKFEWFLNHKFSVILEYNLYPFIIRTLGGLSDFEVTNCQPFLLLHSALICFLGISLCHKGNTFLSNMCCVL